jgi:hypothetical protein
MLCFKVAQDVTSPRGMTYSICSQSAINAVVAKFPKYLSTLPELRVEYVLHLTASNMVSISYREC